jgi:selenocysteine lyase/cysteine desulfurase
MTTLPTPAELIAQFPLLNKLIYVNHATLTPWPRVTQRAVQRFARLNHEQGPMVYREWMDNADRLRALIARMLNAPAAADIALLKNTTEGVNIVANGIDWRSGDTIVTTVADFPSNRLPWEALASRGVKLRCVDVRREADPEAALLDAMDDRTRLLALSSVQWSDGFRLQLKSLGAACRAAGVLFFVDAIQHFGALRVDVSADQVDILSAGSHKWQMGPEGMGVFYCRDQVRERLHLVQHGWHALENRFAFDEPGRPMDASARRFEAGTPSRIGQVALYASLRLLEQTGLDYVEESVLANSARLLSGLGSMPGVSVTSAIEPERRSGIVSFKVKGLAVDELLARLRRADVIAIRRGDCARLSPHYYQRDLQIDALLERIEESVRTDKYK